MNSKAPANGSRDSLDPTGVRVDAGRDREEEGSTSLLTGPQGRRTGDEAHAALTGDFHNILGNTVVRAALSGMDSGPGAIVEGALTLGAAGVQVAESTAGLFTNQYMQEQLAATSTAPQVAVAASALSRHGVGEQFSEEAGKRVDVALKRGGQPLPDALRAKMEAAFGGADFSRVRIHTDGAATSAARGIRAHAFAVGEDVYFGTGEFRPNSRDGQELLAHELTHVVQAQEGRIRMGDSSGGQAGDVAVSSPTDSHEREAVARATEVVGALGGMETAVVSPDQAEATVASESVSAPTQASMAVISRDEDQFQESGEELDVSVLDEVFWPGFMNQFNDLDGRAQSVAGSLLAAGQEVGDASGERLGRVGGSTKLAADKLWGSLLRLQNGTERPEAEAIYVEHVIEQWVLVEVKVEYAEQVMKNWAAVRASGSLRFLQSVNAMRKAMAMNTLADLQYLQREIQAIQAAVEAADSDVKEAWAQAGLNLALNFGTAAAVAACSGPVGLGIMALSIGVGWLVDEVLGPDTGTVRTRASQGNVAVGGIASFLEHGKAAEFAGVTDKMVDGAGKLGKGTLALGTILDGMEVHTAYGNLSALKSRLSSLSKRYDKALARWRKLEPTLSELAKTIRGTAALLEASRTNASDSGRTVDYMDENYGDEVSPDNIGSDHLNWRDEDDVADPYIDRAAAGPAPRNARAAIPDTTGQGLPAQTGAALRAKLGSAVDQVRVHTGPEAVQFARSLNAKAVTVGQDIYFNQGFYRPGTTAGDELIAHEAHHAVIGGGRPGVSQPGDAHEREAVAFGEQFVQSGGTQALSRMGLEDPTEALSSQVNDRLAAVPRGGLDALAVDAELASAAIEPVPAELSSLSSFPSHAPSAVPDAASMTPTASFGVASSEPVSAPMVEPSVGMEGSVDLDIAPVDTAMGSSESMSLDTLTGTAESPTSTTSGTQETTAETYAELTIAGKVYRVKVPPSTGQTATANTDLDAHPCEGLHLTGATVNIDAEGKIVGGTVRGELTVPGLFNGTKVAMAILPGGAVAPAVEGLPIRVGPASGTMDLSITEAGLAGEGTISAAELNFPPWLGMRGGDFTVSFSAGQLSGGGSLDGTPSQFGVARVESVLEDDILVSRITYVLHDNLTPVPWLKIHSGVLKGTLVTQLGAGGEGSAGEGAGGGGPELTTAGTGGSSDVSGGSSDGTSTTAGGSSTTATGGDTTTAPGPGPSTGASSTSASGEGSTATSTGDLDSLAVVPVTSMGSVADSPGRAASGGGQTTSTGSSAGDGGLTIAAAGGQDPGTFMLHGKSTVSVKDWIQGEVDMALDPAAGTFDVTGLLSSVSERKFGELLTVSSKLGITIRRNQLLEATGDIDFKGPKYDGTIKGVFDIENNVLNGTADVRLTHHWPIDGDWGEIRMLRHGKLEAEVVDNELGDIHGRLRFDGLLNGGPEGPLDFEGYLEGTFDPETEEFVGVANGETTDDFILPGGGQGQQFALLKGSQVRASVNGTNLDTVKMDAALRYDREGAPFLEGRLSDAVYEAADGTVSGKGTLTLMKGLERSTTDGQWTIRIAKGTNVEGTVKKSVLESIGGDIIIQVDDAKGKLGQGKLGDAVIDIDTWETSGQVSLTTARKFFYPGEGQLMSNGYGLAVMPGTGIKGTIKEDVLSDVGGIFKMMVLDSEGSLARLTLDASLDLKTEEISGTGTIALARGFTVAEDLGGQGWSAKILRGTKGTGHVEQGVFTKVSGAFKSQVDDDEGKFMRVDGTGEWTTADQMYSVVGKINLTREKLLVDGGDGGWSLALLPGESAANATIEKNVFKGIEGTINTMVRRAGTDFASVKMAGTWKEAEGFNGEGAAELLLDIDVATIGDYHLSVVKGSGAKIAIDADDIDTIGGKVPMRLNDAGEKFIEGHVEGEYKIEEKVLDGTGTATVLVEKHLGTMGSDQLWLIPSDKATVTIKENQLTEVGGQMNLSVRNGEGEYARITLEGSFDAASGTGFTGQGGVTVVRDNQLYASDGYYFWLTKGAGATAHIKQNQLEKIDGQVPFMVRDLNPAPLIKGSVDGTYDPTTGQITGDGEVYLGRTVEYDLGGGVQLKLLAGSGGTAEVNDSKLERLGGTLKAEIWKDGEGYLNITAQGEYDVESNTLTRMSGTATVLKPLQLLGGQIEVTNVQGTATIENNELVEAAGRGDIVIHPLNDMMGWFDLKWSTSGGVETYEGTGNVEFTLIDKDPKTGRGMGGEVGVTAKSDGSFTAVGEVDYAINDVLGGKLQVGVDETWNPQVYGLMALDADLVEARDLFKLEKDLVPEQKVALPYGLALLFGMRGGMGMALDALRLQAAIAVGNWNPMVDGSVPQFETNLDLTWGMNFRAMVAPYLALEGNLGFANARIGMRGEIGLDAPVKASAGGFLKGQGGGFYGELSVGVGIAPTFDLDVIPYIQGAIPGLLEFEQDLDRFEQPLGSVFKFEWGSTYGFGDTQYQHQAPIDQMDIPAPAHKETKHEGRPNLGIGNGGGGQNKRGGPQLESGSEIAGNQTVGDGEMAEVMATLNDIIAVIEGLGAASELFGMMSSAMAALATFGPAGLIVHIVWGIYTGDLEWDKIKEAVIKVTKAIQSAGRLLRKHFPGWWNTVVDAFDGETPGLLEGLYGADDLMREAVIRGDHHYAPYEMQVQMVREMKEGWLSTADAVCIAMVFESAAERGWLQRLVNELGGGSEFIDGWTSFFDDRHIKAVFRRNGIPFE